MGWTGSAKQRAVVQRMRHWKMPAPSAKAAPQAEDGSWWLGLDRDQLSARARREQARMSICTFGRDDAKISY